MPMLENVKVDWAEVIQENKKFGGWGVEVRVTPEIKAQLKSLGIDDKIKTTKKDYKNGGEMIDVDPYIKFRRYPTTRKGDKNAPPTAINADKTPLTQFVGNGSTCNVLIHVYDKPDGSKGVVFMGLQVIDLVSYGDPIDQFDDVSIPTSDDFDVATGSDEEAPFDMYAPPSSG